MIVPLMSMPERLLEPSALSILVRLMDFDLFQLISVSRTSLIVFSVF